MSDSLELKNVGRPRSEETKRVRVPLGCIDDVMSVIDCYNLSKITPLPSPKPKKKKANDSKKVVERKSDFFYWLCDGDGKWRSWSGLGRQPKWFKDYIASGGVKSDLAKPRDWRYWKEL